MRANTVAQLVPDELLKNGKGGKGAGDDAAAIRAQTRRAEGLHDPIYICSSADEATAGLSRSETILENVVKAILSDASFSNGGTESGAASFTAMNSATSFRNRGSRGIHRGITYGTSAGETHDMAESHWHMIAKDRAIENTAKDTGREPPIPQINGGAS